MAWRCNEDAGVQLRHENGASVLTVAPQLATGSEAVSLALMF